MKKPIILGFIIMCSGIVIDMVLSNGIWIIRLWGNYRSYSSKLMSRIQII